MDENLAAAGSLSRNLKCPCNIQNLKSTNSFRIFKTFPRSMESFPFTFQIISCNRNHLCPLLNLSTGFLLRSSHNILVGSFYKRCLTLRIIFLFFLQPHIERSISRTQSVKIISLLNGSVAWWVGKKAYGAKGSVLEYRYELYFFLSV